MYTNDMDRVSVGCTVRVYCETDKTHYEFKIVKSRDSIEYIPQYSGSSEVQNSQARTKIAEYAEDELAEDRPLAKELIGKKRGDEAKVFTYTYLILDIVYPEEETVETVSGFISRVYGDFDKYLNGNNKLCKLKSVGFYSENLPDYSDENVQQLYILRYCLAYAYEYKTMYETVLGRGGFSSEIKAASFGCGSMIDYGALAQVLQKREGLTVDYTGIDLTDWKYKIRKRSCDKVQFLQKNVLDWLNGQESLDSDIYIFPKSISEFPDKVFSEICECFQKKRIAKDRFHIMITLRYDPAYDKVNVGDFIRSVTIYNAVKANGFLCDDNPDKTLPEKKIDNYIDFVDGELYFPQEFDWKVLNDISNKCGESSGEKAKCQQNCGIDRAPMLSTKYARYQIFTFYREGLK